jgi:poly(A) polymerase
VKRTYSFSEHRFPVDKIDQDALYVVRKLQQAGYIAYLVGGSVRDLLLGKTPKDFDISTSALPTEIKKLFKNSLLIGRRFRLAHIRFGIKVIEVSTFRSGDLASEDLIVRDNEWGTPEQDALRRDLTLNGLFCDPEAEVIIDFVEGLPDLLKGVLRPIGPPYIRFKQDPVRMLRILKFQARFGFAIAEDAKIALAECRAEIAKSASPRVLEEIFRMLESGASRTFFQLLAHHGLLQIIFPTLNAFLETHQGEEVYQYLAEVDRQIGNLGHPPFDRAILLTCLVFPFLAKKIEHHFLAREKIPHLGEIQQTAITLIDELFSPLFRLPRRMKGTVTFILSSQYRITPLDKRKQQRIRLPKDPEFPLAFQFFSIRAALEPALTPILHTWSQLMKGSSSSTYRAKKPRKRRPQFGKKATDKGSCETTD